MDILLDELRKFNALRDGASGRDELGMESLGNISPTYDNGTIFEKLSPAIAKALQDRGIDRLYQHQADAMRKAIAGANVVLQAPTASGKTLSFGIPMLEKLISEHNAHALMIYPTKALALDQRIQLLELHRGLTDAGGRQIDSWWYDGDTEKEYRSLLRENPPHILITNPDMVHMSFLGNADLWKSFLSKLKFVVLDEIHEYRGYFGSNVALILRRFFHHLAQQDIRPQYFLSSATCANAKEHAENLTGLNFEEVNATGQLRPRRKFYFVKPDIPHHQYWDILQLRTVNAGLALVANGKSALVFCPTRTFAESCHRTAMRQIAKLQEDGTTNIDRDQIKVFRAGLSVEKRHETQEGLKNGTVRLVFTTNALELGIDIGSLHGVIMAGFPDSTMSAWQRIGRAGRSWDSDSFVLYFARNNPLDQFYASNLHTFLDKPLDDLVINPANEELVERHIPWLLFETPEIEGGESILGQHFYSVALAKVQAGAKPVRIRGYLPHSQVDIRGGGKGMYTLLSGSTEIGTISSHHQFREAYQNAIYIHGGTTYRVEEVATVNNGGTIRLTEAPPYLKTQPSLVTYINISEVFAGKRWSSGLAVNYGKVVVNEVLASVKEVDERNETVVDEWQPDYNPAQYANAHAFWLQQEEPLDAIKSGVLALQHILRVGAMFSIPLVPHDMFPHAVVSDQTVYIIESYPGGIGIARKTLEKWQTMLETGIAVAESCRCSKGCPNCIVPPRTNDELDKRDGVALARETLCATEHSHDEEFDNGFWVPINPDASSTIP